MIHLSTIHEDRLTPFHRNHFILMVDNLPDMSVFRKNGDENQRCISIQEYRKTYPRASKETIANLFLTHLQITLSQGNTDYLLVYNDKNKKETFDLANVLLQLFEIRPTSSEEERIVDAIRAYGAEWTYLLLTAESTLPRIGPTLKPMNV